MPGTKPQGTRGHWDCVAEIALACTAAPGITDGKPTMLREAKNGCFVPNPDVSACSNSRNLLAQAGVCASSHLTSYATDL